MAVGKTLTAAGDYSIIDYSMIELLNYWRDGYFLYATPPDRGRCVS